jgi:hypothetical protein
MILLCAHLALSRTLARRTSTGPTPVWIVLCRLWLRRQSRHQHRGGRLAPSTRARRRLYEQPIARTGGGIDRLVRAARAGRAGFHAPAAGQRDRNAPLVMLDRNERVWIMGKFRALCGRSWVANDSGSGIITRMAADRSITTKDSILCGRRSSRCPRAGRSFRIRHPGGMPRIHQSQLDRHAPEKPDRQNEESIGGPTVNAVCGPHVLPNAGSHLLGSAPSMPVMQRWPLRLTAEQQTIT